MTVRERKQWVWLKEKENKAVQECFTGRKEGAMMKKEWGKWTPSGETAERCERKRAPSKRLDENKVERLIPGSGRVLDECFLLPGFVYRKFFWEDRWLHSLKSFLLHFSKACKLLIPPFMCGETLIGTAATAAVAAAPVLTQTRSRLQLSARTLAAGRDLRSWCQLFHCLSPPCFKDVELIVSLLCVTRRQRTSKSKSSSSVWHLDYWLLGLHSCNFGAYEIRWKC